MAQIAGSSFEGLFIQALKVEGNTILKLKAIGFDVNRMEPAYSVEVWRKGLEVARSVYFPNLSPAEGDFQLGVRMVDGFLNTLVGKLIRAALPFLSADSFCARLPRFLSSGIVGDFKKPEVAKIAAKHYQVTLFGEQGVPWFTAGAVDASLRLLKVEPTVKVSKVEPLSFTVEMSWP